MSRRFLCHRNATILYGYYGSRLRLARYLYGCYQPVAFKWHNRAQRHFRQRYKDCQVRLFSQQDFTTTKLQPLGPRIIHFRELTVILPWHPKPNGTVLVHLPGDGVCKISATTLIHYHMVDLTDYTSSPHRLYFWRRSFAILTESTIWRQSDPTFGLHRHVYKRHIDHQHWSPCFQIASPSEEL